jgi:predicted RND superfamily exporter protein
VVPPIVLGICTTLLGLGFIGWTGINFSPLTFVLAFLVGARKVSHAIQITSRYLEELHLNAYNKEKACYETIRTMSTPNIAGVLTDGAGFAILCLAKIALMQQIAIIMTFWMVTIAAASLTPIICTYIPLKWASDILARSKYKKGWMDKLTTAIARFSIGTGRLVIVGGVIVIMLFSIWQSASLKVGDPTPGTPLLWPNHTYNQDQELINKEFKASSETFTLYYDGEAGSVYDSEVMTTFEKFDGYMQNNLPDIYKSSTSIINLTKMLNLTFHDGDQYFSQLPREDDELAGILGYVRQKTGSAAVRRYLDAELERAQITLFFADHTTDNMLRIQNAAYRFFKEHPQKTSKGEFKLAGGSIGLNMALNEEMKSSHALIDGMVLAAIFFMCSFFFRSFVAGLMLTLPLLVANMGAYAYMGLMKIGLSVNTLPVAAVGVGVGVDFAIYLYSRCIEEYQNCKDWSQTIITAVSTCGKAIVYTGLTLILAIIPWYFLSDLKFQAQMGFFLSMLLFINVVLALTFHPILLMWIKPKFVTRAKVKGL